MNAAGLDGFSRFADISFDDWQRVIDVNLNGVFHCCPGGAARHGRGRLGPHREHQVVEHPLGSAGMAHYVAAKSAVNGLTKSLALEYGPAGITVNAVPPGFIDTPMLRNAECGVTPMWRRHRDTPVRRMGGPRTSPRRARSGLRGSRLHHRTDSGRERRQEHLSWRSCPR